MYFPEDVIVEAAFANDINESRYAQSGYSEITPFVRAISGTLRGRTYEIGRVEAGTLTIDLDNSDRRFSPGTATSPYFPNIKSERRLRIRGKNMLHPNVARGGSRDLSTTGLTLPDPSINVVTLGRNVLNVLDETTQSSETGAGWSPNVGTTVAQSSLYSHVGTTSLQFTATTTGAVSIYNTPYQTAPVVAGNTYRLTAWMRTEAGAADITVRPWIYFATTSGGSDAGFPPQIGPYQTVSDEWSRITYDFVPPAGANFMGMVIQTDGTSTTGRKYYIDDVSVMEPAHTLVQPNQELDAGRYFRAQVSGAGAERTLMQYYLPLEYGVRLMHSAYLWRVTGTAPAGTSLALQVRYFDNDNAELLAGDGVTPLSRPEVALTPTTLPQRVAIGHAPPAEAKYALMTYLARHPTTPSGTIFYGLGAPQTELPANLAPDVSGYWDVNQWQVQGSGLHYHPSLDTR
jgi:hypothetical protein